MKNNRNITAKTIAAHAAIEVVLAGLILCIFATFHHVIPKLFPESSDVIVGTQIIPDAVPEEVSSESDAAATEKVYETSWQEKFAEHFSDAVVSEDDRYVSSDVSVEVTTHTVEADGATATYHVADIYVSHIENFATYFPQNEFRHYGCADAETLDAESGAIVSINGDYCNAQFSGVLVRNGIEYMQGQTECDICVLYCDGTMKTFAPNEYVGSELVKQDVWQVWKFGPALLDNEGAAKEKFNCSSYIKSGNPRSAVGYYEPGHYCFVVVDGRQNGSQGMKMKTLSKLFEELGCTCAYNLDGGASATMTFNDKVFNSPSNGGRELGDILLIREYEANEEAERTQ